ncbi:MAG: hypothetical protein ABR972_14230 [Acidimicrobiales bacterium]|jgi:hypothetical protein
MTFTTWELKVLRDPGAPERIRELGEELRLAAGLTSRKAATAPAACDTEFQRNANRLRGPGSTSLLQPRSQAGAADAVCRGSVTGK